MRPAMSGQLAVGATGATPLRLGHAGRLTLAAPDARNWP
ncbi:MAG: hypothetical protein QOJ04_542 [Caballeronia sp.]|jgi:hypothetical protein|nr:hypothetical protein [Caballeronia sp.]MEA3123989.1 hypothetical protein [Caballeronia sp.]